MSKKNLLLQSSNWCFCGNSYGKHGILKESECNRLCSGDTSEVCGGGWKNSIYATGVYILWSLMQFDSSF